LTGAVLRREVLLQDDLKAILCVVAVQAVAPQETEFTEAQADALHHDKVVADVAESAASRRCR